MFRTALQGGKRLSRPALLSLLETEGISTVDGRGYHLLWLAAQQSIVYIGAMEGKQQTFGLLDELVPNRVMRTKDEALRELAACYFTSHGPATAHDFAWWSGQTLTDIHAAIEAAGDVLTMEHIDGKTYWSGAYLPECDTLPEALLLPAFDEYLLGYRDRNAQMKTEYAARIVPGGNGIFMPPIVLRGQIVGMWKRTLKKDRVVIAATLFEPIAGKDNEAIKNAADRYGVFLGLPAQIVCVE